MKIHGLQKMTLLDYPGKVACTVFFGGCDFRCPFCHNAELLDGSAPAVMDEQELLDFLKKRRGLLDGVAITGGEPLLRPELPALLRLKPLALRRSSGSSLSRVSARHALDASPRCVAVVWMKCLGSGDRRREPRGARHHCAEDPPACRGNSFFLLLL